MLRTHSKRSVRRGLTLVEVTAGIALLATLLVLILTTYRVQATQIRSCKERLKAIDAADRLISEWNSQDAYPAVGTQKAVPGIDGLLWRLVAADASESQGMASAVVRLEVFRAEAGAKDRLLVWTDLLVPAGATAPQQAAAHQRN